LAEFSTLNAGHAFAPIFFLERKTAELKAENSSLPTFRFFPASFHAPCSRASGMSEIGILKIIIN
jgi:hypothetical protein